MTAKISVPSVTDCALSALSRASVVSTLRGDGVGGASFRGEGVGGSFCWTWIGGPASTAAGWMSGEGLGCLGVGVMVWEAAGVSLGGTKVGLRAGLGGRGPMGRSGRGGRSGRRGSALLPLAGRRVSKKRWNRINATLRTNLTVGTVLTQFSFITNQRSIQFWFSVKAILLHV